ncbi:hypothetical protein H6F98_12815 [Microcoleus sp. FACHB-SPT15]|uniref:hypothetical protein n=1 Tax=Microcoleus sp. FACHB-SPT15 TaxID=2692830 RepID=UPI00177DB92A|nr:hypothetical protein [Microcoleus sp. FACHB-SPT15]MBD1806328.1 hypothetical protein [Microcoleus sp. FACHB-SPT15]
MNQAFSLLVTPSATTAFGLALIFFFIRQLLTVCLIVTVKRLFRQLSTGVTS